MCPFLESLLHTVAATKKIVMACWVPHSDWHCRGIVACTTLEILSLRLLLLCDYRDGHQRATAPVITILGATAYDEHLQIRKAI